MNHAEMPMFSGCLSTDSTTHSGRASLVTHTHTVSGEGGAGYGDTGSMRLSHKV